MINLPQLKDFDLKNKKVIVRLDLDVSLENTNRLDLALPTLKYLLDQNCCLILIGHKGRPEGKPDPKLSLMFLKPYFEEKLNKFLFTFKNPIDTDYPTKEIMIPALQGAKPGEIHLMQNLRFTKNEEENNENFSKLFTEFGDFYINEAFATSHRESASIVGIPKLLPHAAGLRFYNEVQNLSKILDNPEKPVITIISGLKDDKLTYVENFLEFSDKILIGGRLPDYIHDTSPLRTNPKVIVADLLPDKEDITIHSIEKFKKEIESAKTIVVSGPIGKFEEIGHRQGTQRVFEAVANSNAFKVAGGGDTENAISLLGLKEKFNWISVGGGAMLEFLAKGTLPGIEALQEHV